MDKVFFMKNVLNKLSEEEFFKKATAIFIKILAGLLFIYVLIAWITIWKNVFDLSGTAMVGGIIFQLLYIIGMYMVIHVMFIRSLHIKQLEKEKLFIYPLSAIIIKMLGEMWASFQVFIGVAGGILIWFAGRQAGKVLWKVPMIGFLGKVSTQGDFLGGLSFMIRLTITGCIIILVFYLVAEGLNLLHKLEKNTRK